MNKKCPICNKNFFGTNKKIYCSNVCREKNKRTLQTTREYKNRYFQNNKEKIYDKRKERNLINPKPKKVRIKIDQNVQKERRKKYDAAKKDEIRFGGNREKVLIRDNYTCQKCRTKENLHVHHKDGSGRSEKPNHEMENLVTLCITCHGEEHKGFKLYRKGKNVTCEMCNKTFYRPQNKLKEKNYCSKECADKAKVGVIKTSIMRNCEVCNKEFKALQSNVLLGKARYCSHECSVKSQIKATMNTCEQCGNEFTVIPAQVKNGRGKYCSKPCYYASKRKII